MSEDAWTQQQPHSIKVFGAAVNDASHTVEIIASTYDKEYAFLL